MALDVVEAMRSPPLCSVDAVLSSLLAARTRPSSILSPAFLPRSATVSFIWAAFCPTCSFISPESLAEFRPCASIACSFLFGFCSIFDFCPTGTAQWGRWFTSLGDSGSQHAAIRRMLQFTMRLTRAGLRGREQGRLAQDSDES